MNKLKRRIKGLKIFPYNKRLSQRNRPVVVKAWMISSGGGGGVGGTPLYDLYGNVPLDRVRVSNPHSLKWSLYVIF